MDTQKAGAGLGFLEGHPSNPAPGDAVRCGHLRNTYSGAAVGATKNEPVSQGVR